MSEDISKADRRETERLERERAEKRARQSAIAKRVAIWGGVVAALFLMVWGLAKLGASTTAPTVGGTLSAPVTASDWTRNNPSAAVTLVEYSDFQCPACSAAEPTVRDISREFGSRIRLVYRNFPLMQHPYSKNAARAAEAAGKQGKFWEMHDMLFDNQAAWTNAANVDDIFKGYAEKLGLNVAQYVSDVNSPAVEQKVEADISGAIAANVNATPSFFLNGDKLNLQSFSDLTDAVRIAVSKTP